MINYILLALNIILQGVDVVTTCAATGLCACTVGIAYRKRTSPVLIAVKLRLRGGGDAKIKKALKVV